MLVQLVKLRQKESPGEEVTHECAYVMTNCMEFSSSKYTTDKVKGLQVMGRVLQTT